jgi:predicted unusual protein kinase regulating ubiquinone biosynthesis (AarF/ABC1/UbiB family)
MTDPRFKVLTGTWFGRAIATSRLAAVSARLTARRVLGGRLLSPTTTQEEEAAEALAANMEQAKGILMKLGQMASYIEGAAPPATQKILRRLQATSCCMDFSRIEPIIVEELRKELDELYDAFEREPVGTGSLGQVHRAVLGGRPVAVKVQYPGVREAVAIDLANLSRLGFIASLGTNVDGRALVRELSDRIADECNYLQEGAYQQRFASLFLDDPTMLIPAVYPTHTTELVLTSRFVEGMDFYTFAETASQQQRNEAGMIICDFIFRSIFEHGLFNGDPHPGNYLFLDDGRVGFVDFGCVRAFSADFVDSWKRMVIASLGEDRQVFAAAFKGCGLGNPEELDMTYQWRVMQYLHRPMTQSRFTYSPAYAAEAHDILIWNNPDIRCMMMPPEWLFINRLQWGMNSVLAQLGAEGDFGAIMRRYVEGDTRVVGRPPPLPAPGDGATMHP